MAVSVQDSNGSTGTGNDSLTVDAAVTLGSLSPTQWAVFQSGYSGQISISGGSGAYSNLSLTGLPSGLSATLSGSLITIAGTPLQTGPFNLAASVQDSNGSLGSGNYSLTINAALQLGPLTPATWPVNQPTYYGTISVSGGSGSYANVQLSGLPAGLQGSLSGSSVVVTGTPTQSGTFSVGVMVNDTQGVQGKETCSLTITPSVTLGNLSPTEWTANQPGYSGTIGVSGGSGGYQDLQISGLPAGLTPNFSSTSGTVNWRS